jgi:hypothetical protein
MGYDLHALDSRFDEVLPVVGSSLEGVQMGAKPRTKLETAQEIGRAIKTAWRWQELAEAGLILVAFIGAVCWLLLK